MLLLLRLPFLALEECIKSMDLGDQFALANVSKQSQRLVNRCVRNRKYEATLTFEAGEFKVEVTINGKPEELHYLDLEDADLDSIKRVIAQFTNTFSLEELSLDFQEGHTQLFLDVIPFVKEQGVQMGTVYVVDESEEYGNPDNDKLCEFIFKECRDAKGLDLGVPTTPKFYPKLNRFGSYQLDRLVLTSASWITMNHVIRWLWNCKEIYLFSCTFTCREINRFMKEWRKGSGIQNFKIILKKTANFTLDEALIGIPKRRVHGVKFEGCFGPVLGRWNGYVVQKEEGGLDMFVCKSNRNRLDMTTEFTIDG